MAKSTPKIRTRNIVGVDEVGRGSIAGPVCVGVFCTTEKNILKIIKDAPCGLKDSKKLTKIQREKWHSYLKECRDVGLCNFSTPMQSNLYIDRHGIVKAIQKCVYTGFTKLVVDIDTKILLDAGLRPPKIYMNYLSLVKGDEREAVIALASIVAKVERDKYMAKMAIRYPEYGFESNVGYGTNVHYIAIKNKGILPIHRKSFL